jgi:hypothetical protein
MTIYQNKGKKMVKMSLVAAVAICELNDRNKIGKKLWNK